MDPHSTEKVRVCDRCAAAMDLEVDVDAPSVLEGLDDALAIGSLLTATLEDGGGAFERYKAQLADFLTEATGVRQEYESDSFQTLRDRARPILVDLIDAMERAVVGIKIGVQVRILENFESLHFVALKKGELGHVVEVDQDGTANIRFDAHDSLQWVHQCNIKKLEFVGQAEQVEFKRRLRRACDKLDEVAALEARSLAVGGALAATLEEAAWAARQELGTLRHDWRVYDPGRDTASPDRRQPLLAPTVATQDAPARKPQRHEECCRTLRCLRVFTRQSPATLRLMI